ncbi:MAG: choice-of-anchor D domain-containing protein [Myxococcota bacterium]
MRMNYRLVVLSAGLATLVACEDDPSFVASARIEPSTLTFGDVAVDERKTLPIRFEADGTAAYRIVAFNLNGDDQTFIVEAAPELVGSGLGLGQSSTVSVTYVPCPAAWDGDRLRDDFDFGVCPTAVAVADLNITDNTPAQSRQVSLLGTPVQQPNASLQCPPADRVICNDASVDVSACGTISFGLVDSTRDPPCDIPIDIRNAWRNGSAVGTLRIENIEVLVQELDERRTVDGASVGFQILDENREPLRVTPDAPLEIPITAGDEGTSRMWLRYSGAVPGTWRGTSSTGTGLRLTTNDPDNPIITVTVLAVGTAPDISVFPDFFNFETVVQGRTATATIAVRNTGNAALTISGISLDSASTEFQWQTSLGSSFPITLDVLQPLSVFVRYTPVDAGNDLARLEIASNDPDTNPVRIELRGGATPRIAVNPPDILTFAVADPPQPMTDGDIIVCNVGDATLSVSQLDILPAGEGSTSVDDFEIISPSCPLVPCPVDIDLCAPSAEGCVDSCETLTIRYANNDLSSVDEVNFVISSNDPGDPEHRVVLRANDVPCRFPLPQIRVVTPSPCAGEPVRVTAEGSDPGGRPGMNDTIEVFEWDWLFARQPIPPFNLDPPLGESMTFLPERGGTYILGLGVQNSCGRTSQTAATEQILIRDSCE